MYNNLTPQPRKDYSQFWPCIEQNCDDIVNARKLCMKHYRESIYQQKKKRNTKEFWPEYRAWRNMKDRCNNQNNPNYRHYGGRGIRVCQAWLSSFDKFFEDMGTKPSSNLSLDRIDNDGNYEPSNCRWATSSEQAKNKRHPVK